MKVTEIMTEKVATCGPGDSLAQVARTMQERNCGILPIVDRTSKVLGVVTDRDVCLSLAKGGPDASLVDARTNTVHTCAPGDDLEAALQIMCLQQVRRLPVVDGAGILKGILSLHDVAMAGEVSGDGTRPAVPAAEVLNVLRAVCARNGKEPGRKKKEMAASAALPAAPKEVPGDKRVATRRQLAERRTRG